MKLRHYLTIALFTGASSAIAADFANLPFVEFSASSPESAGVELGGLTDPILVTGTVKNAYLKIEAGADGTPLMGCEYAWFKIGPNGGHINTLKKTNSVDDTYDEYDLSKLSYFESNSEIPARNYVTKNLVSELKGYRKISAFVNSGRANRSINIKLYYECDGTCSIEKQ